MPSEDDLITVYGYVVPKRVYSAIYHQTYFMRSDVREREGLSPLVGVGDARVEEVRQASQDGSLSTWVNNVMENWFIPTLAQAIVERRRNT